VCGVSAAGVDIGASVVLNAMELVDGEVVVVVPVCAHDISTGDTAMRALGSDATPLFILASVHGFVGDTIC
jgi:hypothetical protein